VLFDLALGFHEEPEAPGVAGAPGGQPIAKAPAYQSGFSTRPITEAEPPGRPSQVIGLITSGLLHLRAHLRVRAVNACASYSAWARPRRRG
jgi:hypothetical protein